MQGNHLEGTRPNSKGLANAKQGAVLIAIGKLIAEKGYLPTVAEITEAAGISSTSTTFYWLEKLEGDGYIVKTPRIHRSIRLTQKGQSALS